MQTESISWYCYCENTMHAWRLPSLLKTFMIIQLWTANQNSHNSSWMFTRHRGQAETNWVHWETVQTGRWYLQKYWMLQGILWFPLLKHHWTGKTELCKVCLWHTSDTREKWSDNLKIATTTDRAYLHQLPSFFTIWSYTIDYFWQIQTSC